MADLIERDAVLAEIGEFQIRFNETGDSHERVAYASAEHCMLVIKAAPAVNRWIPCSERMPEQSEEGQPTNVKCSDCVLAAAEHWVGMAYYVTYGKESQWEFADAQRKPKIDWTEVTHWMSIPEPPEKE